MKFNESASFSKIGEPCPVPMGTRIVLVTMPHDPEYHEPPVAFIHSCKFQGCKRWDS